MYRSVPGILGIYIKPSAVRFFINCLFHAVLA